MKPIHDGKYNMISKASALILQLKLDRIYFLPTTAVILSIALTDAGAQGLDSLKPNISAQEKAIYSKAIHICIATIRDRIKDSSIQIFEPCDNGKGKWQGIERIPNGYKFNLSVMSSKRAPYMSLLTGDAVRVICQSDLQGNITSFEDGKETASGLFSRPLCGRGN